MLNGLLNDNSMLNGHVEDLKLNGHVEDNSMLNENVEDSSTVNKHVVFDVKLDM